ncbi:MAG TPA: hypothetical protein VNJ52_04580 [Patescibacteria group bacterium]|nr:hypothetical protein [Patescibacteria group bacterium]
MKVFRPKIPLRAPVAACALLALCAAAALAAQTVPGGAPARPPIAQRIEAAAEAYRTGIAKIPIEVGQTERFFDASGHLKRTRRSSYRYAFPAASPQAEADAELSDGVTLPLAFLPGSIRHLSLRAETPAAGPWILHFKSTPCSPPDVHRHWMESNIVSQCVEGEAFVDPKSGALTRIRMEMGGLPVGFRSLAYPRGVIVVELYNDATFRLVQTSAGAAPQLVPVKARYVTYTNRGRTEIDQTFTLLPASPPGPGSP